MGQVALGIRSLVVKLAIFFAMAALLAWALGGTLWPRAEIVTFDGVTFQGRHWYWQMEVGGSERGAVRWQLMVSGTDERQDPLPVDGRHWAEVTPRLVVSGNALYFAGKATTSPDEPWRIERTNGKEPVAYDMPDRLAVEQQMERVADGLEIQDAHTILAQRPVVVDPASSLAGP